MSLPIGSAEKLHSQLPLRSKQDVLDTLYALDLPADEYFLVGGANMVLRGVKKHTRDIDSLVSARLFDQLVEMEGVRLKDPPKMARDHGASNQTVWLERTDLPIPFTATTSMGDGYFPQSFDMYRDRVEIVEGFPCVELDVVRASKLAIQRPAPASDMLDIRAIQKFLGEPEGPLPSRAVVYANLFS